MVGIISLTCIILGFVIFCSGCTTQKGFGCSNRQHKRASKFFYKGLNLCQAEVAKQSQIAFPFIGSDTNWTEIAEGEIRVDTFTHYDTLFFSDTVMITKIVTKNGLRVDTVFKTKESKVIDQRAVIALQGKFDETAQSLSDAEKKLAKATGEKNIWKWISISFLIVAAIVFGIKVIIPKVLS